eukprot:scaffold3665_cov214-Amphora_coffeaeformis.AAC.4
MCSAAGRGSNETGELIFGLDLLGHEVQETNPEWPNVLPGRQLFVHDHDTLAGQDFVGGKLWSSSFVVDCVVAVVCCCCCENNGEARREEVQYVVTTRNGTAIFSDSPSLAESRIIRYNVRARALLTRTDPRSQAKQASHPFPREHDRPTTIMMMDDDSERSTGTTRKQPLRPKPNDDCTQQTSGRVWGSLSPP